MVSQHPAYIWRCLTLALSCALWLTASANAAGPDFAECGLKPTEPGTIVATHNMGELSLQDGRKLKLAGVRLAQSQKLLADLIGQTITPYPAAKRPDRTGFTPAHILLSAQTDNQPPVWLQQKLLQQGNAFIYIYPDQISCASALRSSEETARQSGTGIWNLDLLHPTPISTPKDTQAFFLGTAGHFDTGRAVGHYGIIRGHVLSTGSAGRWRYLNFGRSYTQDFTVRLTANVEKRLSEHGFTLKGLKDRTIEVRGIVQSNGGPLVDVFDTAQIVIME